MSAPGKVILFGSGETAPSGRRVYHQLFEGLGGPVQMAVLETPAGFQPNSAWVAGQVVDFIQHHLQNFRPQVAALPARRRAGPFSTDDPGILAPLLTANVIFMGAGSPTYAVQHLRDSLAWHLLTGRHRLGATVIFASAATVAVGRQALPVYEIYKVGEPPHWKPGLDFFGAFGLELVIIPHWNNGDGGENLDTSRCFMGRERFERLLELLPGRPTVLGIDEHTALYLDFVETCGRVEGAGGITILRNGHSRRFQSGETLPLAELGDLRMPQPAAGLPAPVWERLGAAPAGERPPEPPESVIALAEERADARARRDWAAADSLREQVGRAGWSIQDTPEGYRLAPLDGPAGENGG